MSSKHSPVWNFFTENGSNAKCNICKTVLSRGTGGKKTLGNGSLFRHLKSRHPTEYREVVSNSDKTDVTSTAGTSGVKTTNVRSVNDRKSLFQATIPEWTESKKKLDFNSAIMIT